MKYLLLPLFCMASCAWTGEGEGDSSQAIVSESVSGFREREDVYKDGKRNGRHYTASEKSGFLTTEAFFKDGEAVGVWSVWADRAKLYELRWGQSVPLELRIYQSGMVAKSLSISEGLTSAEDFQRFLGCFPSEWLEQVPKRYLGK